MKKQVGLCILLLLVLTLAPGEQQAAGGPLIFAGRLTDTAGRAVPGAEVRLADPAGRIQRQAISDIDGRYRIPAVADPGKQPSPYRLTIEHARFLPVRVDDALAGAKVTPTRISYANSERGIDPGTPARVASQNFQLAPAEGVPFHPTLGAVDLNMAEYFYREANLLLSAEVLTADKRQEAVDILKVYAQVGGNIRHIARALELVAQFEPRP